LRKNITCLGYAYKPPEAGCTDLVNPSRGPDIHTNMNTYVYVYAYVYVYVSPPATGKYSPGVFRPTRGTVKHSLFRKTVLDTRCRGEFETFLYHLILW
jgi:hypothetical protein